MLSRSLLLLVLLSAPLWAGGEPTVEKLFDLEFANADSMDASRVEEFFPAAMLRINSDMSEEEAGALLKTIREASIEGIRAEEIPPGDDEFPLPYFFESYQIKHTPRGQLEMLWFSAHSLPIRKASVGRLYDLIADSLGPADYTYVTGSRVRPKPHYMYVEWNRPQGALVLELGKTTYSDTSSAVELRYFPADSSLRLVRERMQTTKIELGESTSETVSLFVEQLEAFAEGDGPFPPIPLGETTEEKLIQYGEIIEWKDLRDFRSNQRLNELFRRLEPALVEEFSSHEVPERYEQILNLIMTAKDSKVQVGAAAFLASYGDPAVLPFLERGFEFSSFSQVTGHLGKGMAPFYTGSRLQEAARDFLLGKQNAEYILRNVSTREQVGELWKIRDQTTNAEDQRRLDGILRSAEQNLK